MLISIFRLYLNQSGQINSEINFLGDVSGVIIGMGSGVINGDGIMDFVATVMRDRNLMLFLGQDGLITAFERVSDETPERFTFKQNYPNPFNLVTMIEFSLEMPTSVTLKIYDLQGRELTVHVLSDYPASRYEPIWDATEFTSVVYVYQLQTVTFMETKILTLIKQYLTIH